MDQPAGFSGFHFEIYARSERDKNKMLIFNHYFFNQEREARHQANSWHSSPVLSPFMSVFPGLCYSKMAAGQRRDIIPLLRSHRWPPAQFRTELNPGTFPHYPGTLASSCFALADSLCSSSAVQLSLAMQTLHMESTWLSLSSDKPCSYQAE